jgi:hypothetical protein
VLVNGDLQSEVPCAKQSAVVRSLFDVWRRGVLCGVRGMLIGMRGSIVTSGE